MMSMKLTIAILVAVLFVPMKFLFAQTSAENEQLYHVQISANVADCVKNSGKKFLSNEDEWQLRVDLNRVNVSTEPHATLTASPGVRIGESELDLSLGELNVTRQSVSTSVLLFESEYGETSLVERDTGIFLGNDTVETMKIRIPVESVSEDIVIKQDGCFTIVYRKIKNDRDFEHYVLGSVGKFLEVEEPSQFVSEDSSKREVTVYRKSSKNDSRPISHHQFILSK